MANTSLLKRKPKEGNTSLSKRKPKEGKKSRSPPKENMKEKLGIAPANSLSTPLDAVDPQDLERFPCQHHIHLARELDNCWPRTTSSNDSNSW
jgi:hypothetical protein